MAGRASALRTLVLASVSVAAWAASVAPSCAAPHAALGGRGVVRLTTQVRPFGGAARELQREPGPASLPLPGAASPGLVGAPASAPAPAVKVTPLPIPDFNNPLKRHRMAERIVIPAEGDVAF